jgi:hypothetical protein
MSKKSLLLQTLSVVFVALSLASASAPAANAVGTDLTLTLSGGSLHISAPASAILGTAVADSAGTTISSKIGDVTVTDNRAAAAGSGWIATAISTALTPTSGPALSAHRMSYDSGTIIVTGTVTCTDQDPTDLTGVSPAVVATAITGSNSATWNPTLTVTIPGSFVSGIYTGAITHSVL